MLFSVAFFDIGKNSSNVENNEAQDEASAISHDARSIHIEELLNSTESVESQYNLSDYYPMVNENQKDSDFCWIYASYKSLESALMVQRNEYYNFSEIALAYSYYVDRLSDNSGASFNTGGNFETFAECYQTYGITLESDVSNSIYAGLKQGPISDYEYIEKFSSKELNAYFDPYLIGSNSAFTRLNSAAKIGVIKRFIKKYGAVFSGIQGGGNVGCFYSDGDAQNVTRDVYKFYSYSRNEHKDKMTYQALPSDHAITIVGWNDDVIYGAEKGAFLVMNSWGFEEKSVQLFYVPYSYLNLMVYSRGFICVDESEKISIESSSDTTFSDDFLTGSKDIKNFFSYDDEIWVNYKLDLSSFDSLDVKVSSGNKNFNGLFTITSDNQTKTVKVKLNKRAEFYGGYYTISFYNNESLIGKRGIYVYSGTEINYLKGRTESSLDDYLLDNAFLNADNVVTINVASTRNSGGSAAYFFEFSRTPINNYNFVMLSSLAQKVENFETNSINMRISGVKVISSTNKSLETAYSEEELKSYFFAEQLKNETGNLFRYQFGIPSGGLALSVFDDCLIQFTFSIDSIVYENCTRDFKVNMFISERYNADSTDLYSIFYELNGGDNNEANPSKYPIYNPRFDGDTNADQSMTEVELFRPTRVGSVFVNWYLDEHFTQLVTKLDGNISGNITLYAKWESLNYNYFDLNLAVTGITPYSDSAPAKLPTDSIVYGDSIEITFNFVPVYMSNVNRTDYTVEYYFYGVEIVGGYLNNLNTQVFNLNFPALKSGNHIFTIKVKVVYGLLEVVEEHSIAVNVEKKHVVFGFSEISKVYNGKEQKPTVQMIQDFYAEDFAGAKREDLFNLTCGGVAKDVGIYDFYVSEIYNKNYSFDVNAGSSKTSLEITKREISLAWKEYNQVYDGANHFPEYLVENIIDGDTVEFQLHVVQFIGGEPQLVDACKNAASYRATILIETISNPNYTATPVSDFEFEIKKSKIRVIMHNTTDRIQTRSDLRAVPEYTVIGVYHSAGDLNISIATEAMVATKSGTYTITARIMNDNYEAECTSATYTLTGYYNVYYLLSNGKTYTERVEEGEKPVGVTKEQLGVSRFSKISYSDDYLVTGEDIYVEVEYTNYTFVVYSAVVAVIVGVIWLVYKIKRRESRVR